MVKDINIMINVQILPLILSTSRLFLCLRVITLPHKLIIILSWFSTHPNLLRFFILRISCGSVHLILARTFHFLLHCWVNVLRCSLLLLLAKGRGFWLGHIGVDLLVLVGHHWALVLSVLNHYRRTLLLLSLKVIKGSSISLHPLRRGRSHLSLLLSVVKTIRLPLLGSMGIRTQRARCLLVIAIVLVLLSILIEHFGCAMYWVGDAVDLLLLLHSPKTIVVAWLLGSLSLIVTREIANHGLRRRLLTTHVVADHGDTSVYQFGFALLGGLVDGGLSEAWICLRWAFDNHFLLVDGGS